MMVTEKHRESIARILSKSVASRSRDETDKVTPAAPNPNRAVEIMRKPKWYHSDTDKTLVSDNSNSKVENEMMKIPRKCLVGTRVFIAVRGKSRSFRQCDLFDHRVCQSEYNNFKKKGRTNFTKVHSAICAIKTESFGDSTFTSATSWLFNSQFYQPAPIR